MKKTKPIKINLIAYEYPKNNPEIWAFLILV
jgi:hypothetical protein